MNIEQAKAIPLAWILEQIGSKPTRDKPQRSTYLSPLRNERTPSFQVNKAKNLWHDFGIDKGGSVIDFACAWLESSKEACTVSDALGWIENLSGNAPVIPPFIPTDNEPEEHSLILKKAKPVKHRALVHYLESRGIPLNIASPYVVEVLVHNRIAVKTFLLLVY